MILHIHVQIVPIMIIEVFTGGSLNTIFAGAISLCVLLQAILRACDYVVWNPVVGHLVGNGGSQSKGEWMMQLLHKATMCVRGALEHEFTSDWVSYAVTNSDFVDFFALHSTGRACQGSEHVFQMAKKYKSILEVIYTLSLL